MGMSKGEILGRFSRQELIEWQVYASIEPIGGRRLDYLFAMLYTLLANQNRRRGDRRVTLRDMLPDWWRARREPMDAAGMLGIARSMTKAMGGTVGPGVEGALRELQHGEAGS